MENKNIDLTKILKNCPKGTKLYSTIHGEVEFEGINDNHSAYKIEFKAEDGDICGVTIDGKLVCYYSGECILFPAKDQRDWSKFKPKKPKFDPKTLLPFDRVLARLTFDSVWCATFFSHYNKEAECVYDSFVTTSGKSYSKCIPYNDETKYLIGTTIEAPEYYRYWED